MIWLNLSCAVLSTCVAIWIRVENSERRFLFYFNVGAAILNYGLFFHKLIRSL